MYPPKKSVAPLVLGILAIIFGLLFALIGLILGIIGLVLALNDSKSSEAFNQAISRNLPFAPFNYKTEIILNTIGIVLAIANMVAAIFFYVNL